MLNSIERYSKYYVFKDGKSKKSEYLIDYYYSSLGERRITSICYVGGETIDIKAKTIKDLYEKYDVVESY